MFLLNTHIIPSRAATLPRRPLCDLPKADLIFSVPSLCPSYENISQGPIALAISFLLGSGVMSLSYSRSGVGPKTFSSDACASYNPPSGVLPLRRTQGAGHKPHSPGTGHRCFPQSRISPLRFASDGLPKSLFASTLRGLAHHLRVEPVFLLSDKPELRLALL